jgi:hypothetical protein
VPFLASRPRPGWSSGSLEGLRAGGRAVRSSILAAPQRRACRTSAPGRPLSSKSLALRLSGHWLRLNLNGATQRLDSGLPVSRRPPCALGGQGSLACQPAFWCPVPVALKVPVAPLLKAGAGTVQRASDGITAAPPERQPERQPEHRGTQLGSSNHPAPWAPTGAKAQTRPLASALSRQVLTIIRAISVRTPQAPGLSVVTAFATLQSRERPAVPGRPLAHKAQHCDKCAHNGVIHKMLAPSRRPRCGHTLKCWAWSLNRARRMGNSGQSTSRTTSRRC